MKNDGKPNYMLRGIVLTYMSPFILIILLYLYHIIDAIIKTSYEYPISGFFLEPAHLIFMIVVFVIDKYKLPTNLTLSTLSEYIELFRSLFIWMKLRRFVVPKKKLTGEELAFVIAKHFETNGKESRESKQFETNGEEQSSFNMNKNPHGMALVFHNSKFNNENIPSRYGSQVDIENLNIILSKLGYKERIFQNLNKDNILNTLQKYAEKDHSQYDSFMCWILSHGSENSFYGSDGIPIKIDVVKSYFSVKNCPSLADKPKMFIYNCCRGNKEEIVQDTNRDFFCSFSTSPGFYQI